MSLMITLWLNRLRSTHLLCVVLKFAELIKSSEVRRTLIDGFNAYSHKPYFGAKADGKVVYDLKDMTYYEVALRMVQLMCPEVPGAKREWIDPSYRSHFVHWVRCVLERFAASSAPSRAAADSKTHAPSVASLLSASDATPDSVLAQLRAQYPLTECTTLSPEDELLFQAICKRRGKPVLSRRSLRFLAPFCSLDCLFVTAFRCRSSSFWTLTSNST
jgi:enoyl reductase-like protein